MERIRERDLAVGEGLPNWGSGMGIHPGRRSGHGVRGDVCGRDAVPAAISPRRCVTASSRSGESPARFDPTETDGSPEPSTPSEEADGRVEIRILGI